MALTRVAAAGINTGGTFVLENVNTSGIVTAGTVQVGAATTIHSAGIDLGSGNITSHNINSTGIVTATSLSVTNDATVGGALTVTGDLTVNGTTTTIDTAVTAVDSLAIDGAVTSSSAVVGSAVTINSSGINATGVITATSFIGDGSNLTGIDATQIVTGNTSVQTVDTGSDGHVKVTTEGTERLRIDSSGNLSFATDTDTYISHPASDTLALTTGGTERLRILSDGTSLMGGQTARYRESFVNLELRTDSSTIGGSMRLVNHTSATVGATCQIECDQNYRAAGKIIFGRENGNNWQASAASAYSFISFHTNAGGTEAEKLRITSGGNVGIGTDNPTTKLVVQGDWVSSTGQLRIKPSSAGQTLSGFTFGTQDNTLLATNYSNSSTGNLYFQNNTESGNIIFTGPTLEHFRITSGGNIGIGVDSLDSLEARTSQAYRSLRLQNANITAGNSQYAYYGVNYYQDTDGVLRYIDNGYSGRIEMWGDYMSFNLSTGNADDSITSSERLRIDSSGNLHLGYNASSNAGTEKSNIVAAGGGLQIARNQTGSPAVNEWLGAIGFQGYLSGNSTSSADARIHAKAAANHSGTSAGTDLIFSTKPTTAGPGSAPTERMSITAAGQIKTGQININAFSNEDNAIGGYTQIASDNHANTFFGQNFKLGASAGTGTHTLEVINQHASIGGAGMYIGGSGNSTRINTVTFYAVAANQSPGTNVTNMDRLRITPDNTFFWTQPTNYYNGAQSYVRTFGFTFNMADGEEEVMFYNPDGYRTIYYQIYIQSGHGSNGYGYILCNTSRYGTTFHDVDWHVSLTTYAHASSVNGNANYNGVKLVRSGTYGTVTYYVIVKAFSPAGGNPFSTSGLTDATYRYLSQGF